MADDYTPTTQAVRLNYITACSALGGLVFEWAGYPDEGVGRDDYTEWAREVADADTLEGERARSYLSRIATDRENGSER